MCLSETLLPNCACTTERAGGNWLCRHPEQLAGRGMGRWWAWREGGKSEDVEGEAGLDPEWWGGWVEQGWMWGAGVGPDVD